VGLPTLFCGLQTAGLAVAGLRWKGSAGFRNKLGQGHPAIYHQKYFFHLGIKSPGLIVPQKKQDLKNKIK
jgi:hypothetical protein